MCLGRKSKSVGSASEVPAGALCMNNVDLTVEVRAAGGQGKSVNHISQRALQLQQLRARHKDGDEVEEER